MNICDRCGLVLPKDRRAKYSVIRHLTKGDVVGAYPLHLCESCSKELTEWMEKDKAQNYDD